MANYFLGSVGRAEAFKYNATDKKYELMFVSNTLTDQAINISTSQDELRAGTGAPVVATFTHDTTIEITLTDVFWKREYISAQLGLEWERNSHAFQTETLTVESGKITLAKTPITINMGCGNGEVLVWVNKAGSADTPVCYNKDNISGKAVTVSDFTDDDVLCVRYLADNDPEAASATVYTSVVPQELTLIITTPLYAGDACAASNGRTAGEIQFRIPRFKLNGAQDFSFAMSSNTTMSLAGKALGVMSSCDPQENSMLEIIEVKNGQTELDGLKAIYFEDEEVEASEMDKDDIVKVYGIYEGNVVGLLDTEYKYSSGRYAFKFTPTGTGEINQSGKITTAFVATDTLKIEYVTDATAATTICYDELTVK